MVLDFSLNPVLLAGFQREGKVPPLSDVSVFQIQLYPLGSNRGRKSQGDDALRLKAEHFHHAVDADFRIGGMGCQVAALHIGVHIGGK